MRYCWVLPLFALASCNQPSPPDVEVTEAVATPSPVVEAKPPAPAPVQPAAQPKKEEPPAPTFPFPSDAAGKELPRVVAPKSPAPAPAEKFGTAPKPRTIPTKLIDPDAAAKVIHVPPTLLPEKPKGMLPTAPPDRVPLDLGFGAAGVPQKPLFAEAPGIREKARDVNQPPELAPLGRQVADRASLDDPTAEAGNAVVVNRTPMPVLVVAGFLKISLPDPFELGEQVKPRVQPAAEPSPLPVPVNPQRIK